MLIRLCGGWAVVWLIGCSTFNVSASARSKDDGGKPWLIPPHILEFTGPLLKLFGTNTAFGARVTVSQANDAKSARPAEGLVLFRDGNSIFEPDSAPIKAPRAKRKDHEGDFGFLIVGLANQGFSYVISEGVSGYAQVPANPRSSDYVAVESDNLGRERAAGYDCLKRVVAVSGPGVESQSFVVWYATQLRGFPVKIERRHGGPPLVFTFSKIRFERPNESLFAAPSDGYTHYESLGALTDEMTRRVWNVMQRPNHSIAFPPNSTTTRPGYSPTY